MTSDDATSGKRRSARHRSQAQAGMRAVTPRTARCVCTADGAVPGHRTRFRGVVLTRQRQIELECTADAELTEEELAAGYHFCPDFDYSVERAAPRCEWCGYDRTAEYE